jgi:hypothetical protein
LYDEIKGLQAMAENEFLGRIAFIPEVMLGKPMAKVG